MTAVVLKSTIALLLGLAFVITARRSRASLRHLILAALFAFLLLLPLVQRFAPAVNIEVQNREIVDRAAIAAPLALTPPPLPTSHSKPTQSPSLSTVLATTYAAGVSILLSLLGIGILRLRRLADVAEVWLEGTARMNEIALAADIRRPALVVLSDEISVPLTFGFRRSTIVVPVNAKAWSDDELARALRHELEHVRREDWLLQLAARAACAFYWPHPLVWVAWRRFCLEAERACDDAVIGASEPEAYAGQLVSLARSVRRTALVPALSMATRSKLATRIEAILDPGQRRGPHSRAAAIAAATVLFALLASVAPARLIAAATQAVAPVARGNEDHYLAEALVKASEVGDVQDVQRILDLGVDVNAVALGDGTALIGAARGGQMHVIQYLLERRANPNVYAPGDGSPLIAAARAGYVEIVDLLLKHGANIDDVVVGDENALMQSAWEGHRDVVRLLIDEGADVNARSVEQGEVRTPLRLARRGGHDAVVRMLLEAGARD